MYFFKKSLKKLVCKDFIFFYLKSEIRNSVKYNSLILQIVKHKKLIYIKNIIIGKLKVLLCFAGMDTQNSTVLCPKLLLSVLSVIVLNSQNGRSYELVKKRRQLHFTGDMIFENHILIFHMRLK